MLSLLDQLNPEQRLAAEQPKARSSFCWRGHRPKTRAITFRMAKSHFERRFG